MFGKGGASTKIQEKAALRLQCAYRCYSSRGEAKNRYRSQHLKFFSDADNCYAFRNKKTNAITFRAPSFFMDEEEIPPSNPMYKAPFEYNPGLEDTRNEFFLLVTINTFPLGSWGAHSGGARSTTDLEDAVFNINDDHDAFAQLLGHDFICKYRPENMFHLKNCTTEDFLEALIEMRRKCSTRSSLVVYITTHVITVTGADKEHKKEDTYFAMHNSVWGTPADLVETTISFSNFAILINKIASKKKTIIINCCHFPKPLPTLFKSPKILYPPAKLYSRLATACQCVVIGSCAIGSSVAEYLQYFPPVDFFNGSIESIGAESRLVGREAAEHKQMLEYEAAAGAAAVVADKMLKLRTSSAKISPELSSSKQMANKAAVAAAMPPPPPTPKGGTGGAKTGGMPMTSGQDEGGVAMRPIDADELYKGLMADWQKDISVKSPPAQGPVMPGASWERLNRHADLTIVLPSKEERDSYNRRLLFFQIKSGILAPSRFVSEQIRKHKVRTECSPSQTTLLSPNGNLFSRAMLQAFRGAAHNAARTKSEVTVFDLFFFLYHKVKKDVLLMNIQEAQGMDQGLQPGTAPVVATTGKNGTRPTTAGEQMSKGERQQSKDKDKKAAGAKSAKTKESYRKGDKNSNNNKDAAAAAAEGKNDEEEAIAVTAAAASVARKAKYTQSPLIFVPPGRTDLLSNPVCFRCSPPPPPDKPFVIQIGSHEVTLEWYDPPFGGVLPSQYKLYMRNVTRNFNKWSEVYTPGPIKKSRYQVRNLPMGVACQFRVRAFNNGGWGALSEPTMYCTPGEDQNVLESAIKWRRLHAGGAIAMLDRLNLYPFDREEHINGLRRLVGFGQNSKGYKNSAVSMSVAELCMRCLNQFKEDPLIANLCFICLAWSMSGKKAERKVRNFIINSSNLKEVLMKYFDGFRSNSDVINSISFLRSQVPAGYLPDIPEYEYKTLNPQPKKPDELDEEEKEEEEEEEDLSNVPINDEDDDVNDNQNTDGYDDDSSLSSVTSFLQKTALKKAGGVAAPAVKSAVGIGLSLK